MTVCAGILNDLRAGNDKLYLTLIGGGVFGNEREWILDAIERALHIYRDIVGLGVVIVGYGYANRAVGQLISLFQA